MDIIILSLFILFAAIFVAIRSEDIEVIENYDGHVICTETNESCIKDILYTDCNNCEDCPIYNKKKGRRMGDVQSL